ncbi:uncharacterized protein LOC122375923 [Amphibalanus amphitrite]|uniref:uncharacterized protein LOC122375923 n=1 Tax=Amphibalanus amphitrite TaxID=1232801 RepID=UPI001C919EEF|nr:uncharacterized protein LOC122375923 [Amphibalanus amphitrite]
MAPTKEELYQLKLVELQSELEARGLEVTGKKVELVDRLWSAMEISVAESVQGAEPLESGTGSDRTLQDPQVLVARLRLMKERHQIEQERLSVKAKAEQAELSLRSRAEQIDIELKLADMGHHGEDFTQFQIGSGDQGRAAGQDVSPVEGALAVQLRKSLLPPTEIKPFSGDVEEFRLFLSAFESRIESRSDDRSELLFYLEQFTRGKANQLVKSCLHLGGQGYERAKQLLEERYGSPLRLIDSYVEKVRAWGRVPPGDVEALDRFALFLTEVLNAMSGVAMSDFEHPSTLRLIISKLPPYLQDRWLREVDRLGQTERRMARFSDVVGFLTAEVRVRKNPFFGFRPAESNYRTDSSGAPRRHAVNVTQVTSGSELASCVFCGGSHGVADCRALGSRPWRERRGLLMQHRLCFACARRGHQARLCRKPQRCRVCAGPHLSVFHGGPAPSGSANVQAVFQGEQPTRFAPGAQRGRGTPVGDGGAAGAPLGGRVAAGPVGAMSVMPPGGEAVAPSRGADQPASRDGYSGAVISASLGMSGACRTALPVVAVCIRGPSGKPVVTNALLDPGSSGSFLTERLASCIGARAERTSVDIDTVGSSRRTMVTSLVPDVEVRGMEGGPYHRVPPLLTIGTLPVTLDDRCQRSEVAAAPHLQGIDAVQADAPVELLLGSDCAELIVAEEVRPPPKGEAGLCAVRTALGWYVIGRVPGSGGAHERLSVNFLRVQGSGESPPQQDVSDVSGCFYRHLYEQDFQGMSDDSQGMSVEDREWLASVRPSVTRDKDGHFEVPLPKAAFDRIPDSLPTARRRLESLRRRFKSDSAYFAAYRRVITSLIEDGYAVAVPEGEMDADAVWYLPHHGVLEPRKGKLRVVFDCAAKSQGICLNDLLRAGPILTNSLIGVLCRFREGSVAFTCDVESMYHRVHVPEADSNLLRFLWFRNGDPDGEVQVFRMRSHVFGAVSSGSVASLALGCCAEEGRDVYPEAADALLRNTYVDDALCATDSVQSAVQLAHGLKELCRNGSFNMTKFTSNSPEFLKQIPVGDRGKQVKSLDLDKDELVAERVLGMKWDMECDVFTFQFCGGDRPVTRRGLLSTVGSVFDPRGIVAPVVLTGRLLLQKLCVIPCGWDEPLPEELSREWQQWLARAAEIGSVQLPRSIVGPPGEAVSTQLHVFADASELAYSAVAYLRREVRAPGGEIQCSVVFLMGRSLVKPVRFVSIPRLELAAAVLAVRVRKLLQKELDIEFDDVRMWTDSMVVLGCVRNRTTRFKTYVANRLSYIHDGSQVSDWAYVPSGKNPADMGSRGSAPGDLGPWLTGPEFLTGPPGAWPEEPAAPAVIPAAEVKRSTPVAAVAVDAAPDLPVERLLRYFSSYYRLKRSVAWYRKFAEVIRSGDYRRWCLSRRKGLRSRPYCGETLLTVAELSTAEGAVLRYVQRRFAECPNGATSDGAVQVTRRSPLAKLRPMMQDGLMVVGGRLGRSRSVADYPSIP